MIKFYLCRHPYIDTIEYDDIYNMSQEMCPVRALCPVNKWFGCRVIRKIKAELRYKTLFGLLFFGIRNSV